MAEPRSEREFISREMNRFNMSGRSGDWLSMMKVDYPVGYAKICWLQAEYDTKAGYEVDAMTCRAEAKEIWPEVVNWTGRHPLAHPVGQPCEG